MSYLITGRAVAGQMVMDPPVLRACYFCGKVLDARAGFIETVHQPDGLRRDFCSAECLHWQLHEDEKL